MATIPLLPDSQGPIRPVHESGRVTVSKQAFDRAFRCRDFLAGVPEEVLALRGVNSLVDLMLGVMQSRLQESAPVAGLIDEAQAHFSLLTQGEAYTPRAELLNLLRSAVVHLVDMGTYASQGMTRAGVPDIVPAINKLLPDYCPACDGSGLRATNRLTLFSSFQLCRDCDGYGHTKREESTPDTSVTPPELGGEHG